MKSQALAAPAGTRRAGAQAIQNDQSSVSAVICTTSKNRLAAVAASRRRRDDDAATARPDLET
jgi:hypothetical protein